MRILTNNKRTACLTAAIVLATAAIISYETVRYERFATPLWMIPSAMALVIARVCYLRRKWTDRELQSERAKIQAIVETSQDWIWSINLAGHHTYSNPAVKAILGYSPDEIMELGLSLVHDEDRAMVAAQLPDWIAEKRGWSNLLLRWRHKDGGYRYLESSAAPIFDDGELVGFRGVDRDITELKRSEEHARGLVSAIADAVFVHDTEGVFHEANNTACEMFGHTAEELIGMRVWDLWQTADREETKRLWADMTVPATVVGRHRRADGSEFPVEVRVARAADGMFVATVRDTSYREEVEEQLRQAVLEADAANIAKSEFLANMSHEIRTPLTAILGFAEMLEIDGDLDAAPPSRVEAVRTIRRNGDHLLRIISDILDLSKIDAGKLEIPTEPCDLRDVVTGTVDSFCSLVKPGVELSMECPSVTVGTSPVRLRQILLNLVGNAVKFTESGSVRVTAAVNQNQLTVDVDDTGPGMRQDQADELFAPFHQLDNSATRQHGGAGLGLAISYRLAEAMGGHVGVARAEPGQGCTFRLSLPITVSQVMSNPAPDTEPLSPGLRVLVVEDQPDSQHLLVHMLTALGAAQVDVSGNGEQAVTRVADGGEYDIILMDMHMPVMDGYTATRLLRGSEYPGPIVAVTADVLSGTIEKCVEAGCDGYLSKPVNAKSLSVTISEVLSVACATV